MKRPIVRMKFLVSMLIIAVLVLGILILPKIRVPAKHSDEIPENIFIKPEVKIPEQTEKSSVSVFSLGHSIGRCSGVIVKENKNYIVVDGLKLNPYLLLGRYIIGSELFVSLFIELELFV